MVSLHVIANVSIYLGMFILFWFWLQFFYKDTFKLVLKVKGFSFIRKITTKTKKMHNVRYLPRLSYAEKNISIGWKIVCLDSKVLKFLFPLEKFTNNPSSPPPQKILKNALIITIIYFILILNLSYLGYLVWLQKQ